MSVGRVITQNTKFVGVDTYANVLQQGLVNPYMNPITWNSGTTGSTGPINVFTGMGVTGIVGQEVRFGAIGSTGVWYNRIAIYSGTSNSGTIYLATGLRNSVPSGSIMYRRPFESALPHPRKVGGIADE